MKISNTYLRMFLRILFAIILLTPLLAVNSSAAYASGREGAVYTLSNEASGNEVFIFDRGPDGSLEYASAVSTGGLGNGGGLGSQGALVLSTNGRWLYAVNVGSNEISAFRVTPGGLELTDVMDSGGEFPISLTNYGDILYVLNAGGPGNIAGFRVSQKGKLSSIDNSTRSLSNGGTGSSVGPAQVEFSPDGRTLVVSEKATNLIDLFEVEDGRAEGPAIFASSGATPFGFAITRKGILVVSEAFGGAPDASALSSYRLSGNNLDLISASVPTHQTAACWVVITKNGKVAYTTNAGSNSISSYRIGKNGSLSLLESVAGETAGGPIDMALSRNSRYLYALDGGADAINAFQVNQDGSLESIDFDSGLPASSAGLAAR